MDAYFSVTCTYKVMSDEILTAQYMYVVQAWNSLVLHAATIQPLHVSSTPLLFHHRYLDMLSHQTKRGQADDINVLSGQRPWTNDAKRCSVVGTAAEAR